MVDPILSPLAVFAPAVEHPRARRELWGWCAIGVVALALAGVFALLLALSRTPGVQGFVPWPMDFFGKALVVHVVFAFVVWFLAVFGAVAHLAAWQIAPSGPRFAILGTVGPILAAIACVLIFVPALLDRGEATLNNYVPAIIDPLYYSGLGLLALGLVMPVLRLLTARVGEGVQVDMLSMAGIAAAVVFLVALICFGLALGDLGGRPLDHAFNEDLFWGGGHMLQFLSTILLLGVWSVLMRLTLGAEPASRRAQLGALAFLVAFVLPAPFFYFIFDPLSAEQDRAFSGLLWALGPPTLLIAVLGARTIRNLRTRDGRLPWREPVFLSLVLSAVVFGVGGALGMFIDGADTRTPAHYHGVIAGVMLAMMGLFFGVLLPLLGRARLPRRLARFLIVAFAGGQTVACLGLFLAGGYGAPRKVAGDAQGLEAFGAVAGMAMNGIGALIAVIGGVLFIWITARALFGKEQAG